VVIESKLITNLVSDPTSQSSFSSVIARVTFRTPNSTMELLFSPCTRLHDLIENQYGDDDTRHELEEVNLDVSTEEFLSAERAFTFADLYAMLESGDNMVAWFTPPHSFRS
jgi:hypothetical protein